LALLFPVPSEKRMIDLLCGVTTLLGSSRLSTGCGLLAGACVLIGSPSVRIHQARQPRTCQGNLRLDRLSASDRYPGTMPSTRRPTC